MSHTPSPFCTRSGVTPLRHLGKLGWTAVLTGRVALLVGCLCVFAGRWAPAIRAQVVINEVMPAPSQGNEWVELKNTTDQPVPLAGWTVEDDAGVLTPTPAFATNTIGPLSLFVFEVKNRLNNSGDQVLLRRPDTSQADLFRYSSSSNQTSWSRADSPSDQFVPATPTPGQENQLPASSTPPTPAVTSTPSPSLSPFSTPTASSSATPSASPTASVLPTPTPTPTSSPSPAPTHIIITSPSPIPLPSPTPAPQPVTLSLQLSEIVACAETGQVEWFELYNPNTISITLTGWKVKDASGNTRAVEATIPAYGYHAIELSSAIFNNDGDSFSLLDATGNQLTTVELPACTQGQSVIYTSLGWGLTNTVTKNSANIYTSTTPTASPTTTASLISTVDPLLTSGYPSTSTDLSSTSTTDTTSLEQTLPLLQQFMDQAKQVDGTSPTPSPSPSPSAGQVLGASTNDPPQPQNTSHIPSSSGDARFFSFFSVSHQVKMLLIALSIVMIACGGYGAYEWYTEQRVAATLEIL